MQGMFLLPDGSYLAKDEARPCRCGQWEFLVVRTVRGIGLSVQCPKCVRLRPGDEVRGVLDRTRWMIRPYRGEWDQLSQDRCFSRAGK